MSETMTKTRKEAYQEYLKSEDWQKKRKSRIRSKTKCWLCKGPGPLQLHHRIYRDWYDCTKKDFIPLCDGCHKDIHDTVKNGQLKLKTKSSWQMVSAVFEMHKQRGTRITDHERFRRLRRICVRESFKWKSSIEKAARKAERNGKEPQLKMEGQRKAMIEMGKSLYTTGRP